MNFLAVVCVVVLALHGAESACEDIGATGTCEAFKRYCDNDNARWGGVIFWKKCLKTCNKCGASDDGASDDGGSDDSGSKEEDSCVDKYASSCGGASDNMCQTGEFGDGAPFWKYCMNSCSCCDGSCQERQDKIDAACGDKSSGPSADFFKKDVLDYHNELRAKHQNTPSLTWDNTLQGYATTHCAAVVAANKGLWHSEPADNGGSGENVYFSGMMKQQMCNKIGSLAAQAWYSEIADYDFATGSKLAGHEDADIGHFTQNVWAESTKLGCAYCADAGLTKVFVSCNYEKAGNMGGQYLNQVKPLNARRVLELRRRDEINIPARGAEINIPARGAEINIPERDEPEKGQTPFDSGEEQFEVMERGEPYDSGVNQY